MKDKYACLDENSAFFVNSFGPIEEKDLKTNQFSGKKETTDKCQVITWEEYETIIAEEKRGEKIKLVKKILTFIAALVLVSGVYLFFRDNSTQPIILGETSLGTTIDTLGETISSKAEDSTNLYDNDPQNNEVFEESLILDVEPPTSTKAELATKPRKIPSKISTSIALPDGNRYTGQFEDGKPHGMGTITFTFDQQISSRDIKQRMAVAGDYMIGEFYKGKPVWGKLYDSRGTLKESIQIGR